MTTPAISQSKTVERQPLYGATVICDRYAEITLTSLIAALRAVAPSSVMGDWLGPFKTPPTDALGTGMISIDGVSLTLLNVDQPLPPPFFETGPIPNPLMPNPLQKLCNHRAHVTVMPTQLPQDGPIALATARAVTLLTWAVAIVARAEAIKWLDSSNFVPVALLQGCAAMLSPAGGKALPVWIRFLAGRAHGEQKIIAGTYGLWAFNVPEIEYAPTDLPLDYVLSHTYAVCEQIFRTGNGVKDGDTIDADGKNVFKVEALQHGLFGKTRALRLSWIAASRSFDSKQARN
jgi:hypothetical protein